MGLYGNFVYAPAMQLFARADLDWETIEARAILVNEAEDHYVPDQVLHQFLLDVPPGDRLATTEPLTGKVVLNDGVLDADNSILPTPEGDGVTEGHAIVIYAVIGGEETSPLIIHLDEMNGLPAKPNGTNIDLVWNEGADRIIRI